MDLAANAPYGFTYWESGLWNSDLVWDGQQRDLKLPQEAQIAGIQTADIVDLVLHHGEAFYP